MVEHKPGKADIRAREQTFAGFVRMLTWAVGIAFAILIFLALANA